MFDALPNRAISVSRDQTVAAHAIFRHEVRNSGVSQAEGQVLIKREPVDGRKRCKGRADRDQRDPICGSRARTGRADLRNIVQSCDTPPRLLMFALAAVSAAIIAACATTVQQEIANVPPTSVETPSYYPFQVKGYQNSYPRRRVLVLMPLDSRDFKDVVGQIHEPVNGNPAVGVILTPDGGVVQRIYSSPLGPVVQSALVRSADEAGMLATASNDTLELRSKRPMRIMFWRAGSRGAG